MATPRFEPEPCPFIGQPCEYVPMAHRMVRLEKEIERLREEIERLREAAKLNACNCPDLCDDENFCSAFAAQLALMPRAALKEEE